MQQLQRALTRPYVLVLIATLGLSFTRLSVLAVIMMLVLWGHLSAKAFPKRYFTGHLAHASIGFLAFFAINALFALGISLFGIPVAIPLLIAIHCLLLTATHLLFIRKVAIAPEPVKIHWVLVAAIFAISVLFAAPILTKPTTGNLLNYSVYGYDDATHIQMYRADIVNQGVITQVDKKDSPDLNVDPSVASYPQGIHFNLSLFARSIFQLTHGTIQDIRQLLLIYHSGLILLYIAIIVLITELSAQLVSILRGSRRPLGIISQLGISATVFIAYSTLIYPEIAYAGQSFLATVAMVAGVMLMLIVADKTDGRFKKLAFVFATTFALGTVYTWIVSMLVSFAALLFFALKQKPATTFPHYVKQFAAAPAKFTYMKFTRDYWAWLVIVVGGILSLPQIAVLLIKTTTGLGSLNIDGGIGIPDHTRYLTLILIALGLVVALSVDKFTKKNEDHAQQVLNTSLLLFVPLLLTIFFYAVQTITTGTLTYYFTKTTYLAYLFVIILVGSAFVFAIECVQKMLGFTRTLYTAALVFGIFAIFLSVGRGCLVYAHGTNDFVDANLTNHAGALIDKGVRPRNIISYTGRVYEEDMLFNLITDQLDQYRTPERHTITILAQQKRYKVFKKFVADYTKRPEKTYILVSKATEKSIQNAMPANGNYEIVVINK